MTPEEKAIYDLLLADVKSQASGDKNLAFSSVNTLKAFLEAVQLRLNLERK